MVISSSVSGSLPVTSPGSISISVPVWSSESAGLMSFTRKSDRFPTGGPTFGMVRLSSGVLLSLSLVVSVWFCLVALVLSGLLVVLLVLFSAVFMAVCVGSVILSVLSILEIMVMLVVE